MTTTRTIATDTGPDVQPQTLRVTLDGTIYQLALQYNERMEVWRLDILDAAGAVLAAGLQVRNAGPPINGAISTRGDLPNGLLWALASSLPGADAGLEELGARVQLAYSEAA